MITRLDFANLRRVIVDALDAEADQLIVQPGELTYCDAEGGILTCYSVRDEAVSILQDINETVNFDQAKSELLRSMLRASEEDWTLFKMFWGDR
jgi:hypothetical protein